MQDQPNDADTAAATDDSTGADPVPTPADRPAPKPWRPVPGLADRPSRMAFSDRLFFWFVYLAAAALVGTGVCLIAFMPYRFGWRYAILLIALGVGLFAFGGPSGSQEKGYRQ